MEFITYKIILSFKFVLLYQFSSTLFLAFRGGRGVFGLLDYIFVMLFIVFRYLVLVVSFFLLPFVFVYFAISLILWGEVKLGFSDRYIDESRFILILYTLFLKIPLAGSKYCAYYLLRAVLAGGKNRHGVSLKGFLNNLIFSNLFGSPKWVLELALTFSSDFYYVLGLDLSTKTGLFVRYNLLVESINSNLRTKCRYYVSKCNESRIYTTADGIIFNMYSFLSTSYKNVIKKPILEAVTISGKGEFKRHPLIDSNYSGGTSDGIIKSHTPLKPQSSIQFKKDDGDVDNGVINNLQSKDALGVKPNWNLKDSDVSIAATETVCRFGRIFDDSPLVIQDRSGHRVLKKTYVELTDEDCRNLNFSEHSIEARLKFMEEFKCESNSDYDMLSNIKNNILNCDFDGKKKVANSIGDFDCRLIPNDSRFLTLTHRGKIEKINDIILLRKEFPLNDEIFNASSSDNNSNDGDEAA